MGASVFMLHSLLGRRLVEQCPMAWTPWTVVNRALRA
jgi:hypothetical protein